MIKRNRPVDSSVKNVVAMSDDEENNGKRKGASKSSSSPFATNDSSFAPCPSNVSKSIPQFTVFVYMFIISAVLLALRFFQLLSTFTVLHCLTMMPVLLATYTGLFRRSNNYEERILPVTLVVSVVSAQLPVFVAAFMACAAIVLFSLATLPRGRRLHRVPPHTSPLYVVLATVLLLVVLLTENFMVWVVSATFPAGQNPITAPPPLQDNGRIVLNYVLQSLTKRQVVGLRRLWNVQWSLVACVGASFVVVDVFRHPRRQLYSVGVRTILTLAISRIMRTVSFVLTVLPSQVSNCYQQRYPDPPPTDPWEWIAVGFLPASHGGCNDLIISGHATVTTTLACLSASVSQDPLFQVALWTLLVMDFAVEVYEGFHYSVDMWLGLVVVGLFWRVLQPIENRPTAGSSSSMAIPSGSPTTFDLATKQDVLVYTFPALLGYLQAAWLPQTFANAVIVLYVVMAVFVFYGFTRHKDNPSMQQFYMHYSLHLLLCVMFIALATYL